MSAAARSGPRAGAASRADVDAFELTEIVTRMRRALRASIRAEFPWETLPMAQVEILQRLDDEPGLRIGDLARRHRLAANTVSNLVQQMVTAGLVTRTEDPADRRAVALRLTTAGTSSLRNWQHAHELRIDAALKRLSASDRTAIGAALPALARLATQLESTDPAAASTASPH
jgi:DNA-binding MarR family transcriptional regulator